MQKHSKPRETSAFYFYFFTLAQKIISECPILKPTQQQFEDFADYMEKVEKQYGSQFGMVKIVPPQGWKPRSTTYEQSLQNLTIKNPIEQNPEGKTGIYEFKHMTLPSMSYANYIKQYESRQYFLKDKSTDEIENLFWKSLPYSPPVYGADLIGTLMDESAGAWNLNKLDTVLEHGLQKNLKGINRSYCYIGSWKALFCWHKEDLDLEAINFLHFGKSKFWYCIQSDDSHYLQQEGRKYFLKGFQMCSEYLRHKTSLINPYILKKNYPKIKLSKIEQKPGQFIVAFSGAYHCGFNFGINVAEAVNFANISWLYKLKNAKYCQCRKSTVRMSLQSVINKLFTSDQYKNNQIVIEIHKQIDKFKENQNQNILDIQNILKQEKTQKYQATKKTKKIVKQLSTKQKSKKQKMDKNVKKVFMKRDWQYSTQIQCDRCNSWHHLSAQNSGMAKEQQFYCDYLGKQCKYCDKLIEHQDDLDIEEQDKDDVLNMPILHDL